MGEMVRYRSNGRVGEGYLALPSDGAARPAVILIQERWGLVPHIMAVADRLADAGFVTFAPDLLRGRPATGPDGADDLILGRAMDQAAREVAGAADYLAGRPESTGEVGCLGFHAGGSLALWSATCSDRIVATAGFYPVLPWERMRPEWDGYAGKSAVIHCCGENGGSTGDGVQAARRSIEAAGGRCVLYDYPDTSHAFFNDDRPEVFHQQAAASAWARTLELFRDRLG